MPDFADQQLAALMFTDIVGSVGLQSRLGTEAYTRFVARHDDILKAALSKARGGKILNETGDGFLVSFPTATEAVSTALRLQHSLCREVCEGEPMRIRIGIHMGEVTEMEETIRGEKRAVGMAINLAARIMDLADGGQILLTRPVFDDARQYIRRHPDNGAEESDLPVLQWPAHGRYIFKGNEEPLEIYEVGAEGIAPLSAPEGSEKAKRAVAADEEATLGWRPGVGLAIPRHEDWVIERKIGMGGFGEVWLAINRKTKEERVFKFCFDPERLRSFRRELTLFRLLRDALGKRNDIAALYDVSVESPPFYLESEYVPTGNLSQWVESQGGLEKIPMPTRLDLVARTARAADAAHSVGIVHKDIKPSNILISIEDGEPRPRLADFGIGALADPSALGEFGITQLGFTESIVMESESSRTMTRLYAPPEYLVGGAANPKGDIFSLGVMLYQLASGDLNRPLASGWRRNIDDELLRDEIDQCVDVEPARRYDSAAQLAERLESLEDRRQQLTERRRLEELKTLAKKRRRIITLTGLTCAALAILSAVLGAGFLQQKRLKHDAEKLRVKARQMASKSDYLLAGQLLERDRKPEAVAYLAHSVRSDPSNRAALSKLYATLAASDFITPAYPPLKTAGADPRSGFLGAFNRDGTRLAALGPDMKLTIWDLASGKPLSEPLDHRGSRIRDAAFTNDGRQLVAIVVKEEEESLNLAPHHIRVWDAETGSLIRQEPQDGSLLWHADLAKDGSFWIAIEPVPPGIEVSPNNFHIRIWDLQSWESRTVPKPKGTFIQFMGMTPDREKLVAISTPISGNGAARSVSVFDLNVGSEWKHVASASPWTRSAPPMSVAISPDSRLIAVPEIAPNGMVRIWDLNTGANVDIIQGDEDVSHYVLHVSFSSDSRFLAVGYFNNQATVYDVKTGFAVGPPLRHESGVLRVAISDDSTQVLTGSMDQTARIWDLATGMPMTERLRHEGFVTSGQYTRNGRYACTMSQAGVACVWPLAGTHARGTPLRDLPGDFLTINPDWTTVVTRQGKSAIAVHSLESGETLHAAPVGQGVVHAAEFMKGGAELLLHRGPNHIESWVIGAPHSKSTRLHQRSNVFLDVSRDGRAVATTDPFGDVSLRSKVSVWRINEDPLPQPTVLEHDSFVRAASLSSDGKRAITETMQEFFRWKIDGAGQATPEKIEIVSLPFSLELSDDGERILSGSLDGTLQLWDFEGGALLTRPLKHNGPVVAVAFDRSGKLGATLTVALGKRGHLAALQIWDLDSGEQVTTPMKLPGSMNQGHVEAALSWVGRAATLVFSPNGSKILVHFIGRTTTWDIAPEHEGEAPEWVPEIAEMIAGRRLTENGNLEEVRYDVLMKARDQFESKPAETPLEVWTRWLLVDPSARPVSPTSSWTLDEHVRFLLEEGSMDNVREALKIAPMDPVVFAAIASNLTGTERRSTSTQAQVQWCLEQASQALQEASKQPSSQRSQLLFYHLGRARANLGDARAMASDFPAAREELERAIPLLVSALEGDPMKSDLRYQIAWTFRRLGDVARAESLLTEASAFYRLSLILLYVLDIEGHEAAEEALLAVTEKLAGGDVAPNPIDLATVWRIHDDGSDPGAGWRLSDYDDSAWKTGTGPFGYGDNRENTTLESAGASQHPITTYFRTEFEIGNLDSIRYPAIRYQRDDGVAIYLNDRETVRDNLPQGEIQFQTTALAPAMDVAETQWHLHRLQEGLVQRGKNVIAIELHQSGATSSDTHLQLELRPNLPNAEDLLREMTLGEMIKDAGDAVPAYLRYRLHFAFGENNSPPSAMDEAASALWFHRAILSRARQKPDDALKSIEQALQDLHHTEELRLTSYRDFKVELLRQLERDGDAQREYLLLKNIQPRDRPLTNKQIDLTNHYNASLQESWHLDPELPKEGFSDRNSLHDLSQGAVTLAGVLFDIRGIVQLDGAVGNRDVRPFPSEVTGISVYQKCSRMHFLHATAWGNLAPEGHPIIGEYTIRYNDGSSEDIPMRLGRDVADWHLDAAMRDSLTKSNDIEIIWEGTNEGAASNGSTLALYRSTWTNPHPGKTITHFDFRSARTQSAPFLIAVTVE